MEIIEFADGTTLQIEDAALKKVRRYVQQTSSSKESGGILLGKKVTDCDRYILIDVSEPSRFDKRSRYSFIRCRRRAQQIINKEWKDSGGVVNYLGEWHTHPEYMPNPSQVDRKLICQIISDESNVFSKVFLIIVGTKGALYVGLADSNVSNNIIDYIQIEGNK